MRNSLPRKLLVALLAVLLTASLSAQYTGQSKTSRMRAVGILRIDAKGKARLFPVSLFIDGKYYDARFYQATPVPFAIAGDILYQAQKDGVPEGNFVVQTAVRSPSQWWAEGTWTPGAGGSKPGASSSATRPDSDGDRPVLRRPTPSSSSPVPGAQPSREGKTAVPASADTAQQAEEQDPSRPTLRRGKSEQVQADVPVGRSAVGAAVSAAAAPVPSAGDRVLLAIADIGNVESRPYGYTFQSDERQRDLQTLKGMATEAIRKAAKERISLRGVDPANLADVDVHAFDPDYSNRPVEIFTATIAGAKVWLPPGSVITSPPKVTVTLVARKDSSGRLNQIFLMIADPTMLDVRPSLQFLGAVDADGSGRAQLLFREQVDVHSFGYVLYRATPYDLVKTFETKTAEE
jgi:hypothetical protein